MGAVDEGVGRATAARWRRVRRIVVPVVAAVVVVGAVVSPGFDEREVQAADPSVWALQTATGERFGRVNTVVSEVDTVKDVSDPSELVQHDGTLLVYSNNLGAVTSVDAARPRDIGTATTDATATTPTGTERVVSTEDWVAYLTQSGEVLAGRVSDGSAVSPTLIDPFRDVDVEPGGDRPQFRSAAVAISEGGDVAMYSPQRQTVLLADAVSGDVGDTHYLAEGPTGDNVQLAWIGDRWVLLDADTGLLWIEAFEAPVATAVTSTARLQVSVADGDRVVIADEFGAVVVSLDDGQAQRAHGTTELALGQPAQPAPLPGTSIIAGAWLPAGQGPGALWMSNGTSTQLDYGGVTLGDRRAPQFRSNGSRLILNEARSGWVWGVPSGLLVRSSQQWSRDDITQEAPDDEDTATQVSEPRAPVAEADTFGVRAGRQINLPVLLNDHDANRDVLTVVADALVGLDPRFGEAWVTDDDQSIVIDVAPDATGTATFTYMITDGTAARGLVSEPTTVFLTVKGDDENRPPVWCGVPDCKVPWPAPQVNPGGTVTADVLNGWVDPEGDPIYLASATTDATAGVVAGSPEGQVVFQHTNASAAQTGTVPVTVTVSDVGGAQASKRLSIGVVGEPELRADDIAVNVTAGVATTVDVSHHVTGARGPLVVTDAARGLDDSASVDVASGLAGFTFEAPDPGSYIVDYTVSDGVGEARASARITVVDAADERLATVPLTAFVRTHEDATIDVLSSVTNPGAHVLLLSGLSTEAADGAQLSADIVGHSALRISGSTATGQPGELGVVRYTVSDGSGREAGTATGEVSVVLLESEVPTTPLAVDDAITVRVGTQADIDVLDNDIGPAGNVIALDAASVRAEPGAGLAFPARTVVRYLAPDTAGVYEIEYGAYVLGYPAQRDTATVVVTVLDSTTNAPPVPGRLTGRVAAGETVRLPYDGTGTDPDGDAVSLRRIETQPAFGTAVVSSDGQAILYTADPGFAGQVSFQFSVEDARGETAVATATVGVLAAGSDPRPVTYSDYVQAQVGEGRRVTLDPTGNDVDLAGGDLTLVSVEPDADPRTQEYRDLDARLDPPEGGLVTLHVGDEPGTFAYVYTVRNAAGSTAIGRIILKAVRVPVADVPIIADTVLTAETRDTFSTGVDVLDGKVAWGSGDAAQLTLRLWGEPDDLAVDGRLISGPLPDQARLVPFEVRGTNYAGEEVVSYGFLRVPGDEEVRVALKETFVPPAVDEGESIDFDVLDLVALPDGVSLSIPRSGVRASGNRPGSTCSLVSGTTLRYSASEGDPYTDTCLAIVRVVGQEESTLLPIPIVVIAADPQPILTGATIELSPGDVMTFDLGGMVAWPPGAVRRAVEYALQYEGQQFFVVHSGTSVNITARDGAVPGHVDSAIVSLPSDPATSPVALSLKVGPAPSELPKGASVVAQCSQARGTSCDITVVGREGEVNPLPGTPLTLVSVEGESTCPTVDFAALDDATVRATWQETSPGGVCDASFVVRDAQGRLSSGDRIGALSLDLQGYPAAPAQVRQSGFADGVVLFEVDPGAAATAHPALSGFAIYQGTTQVSSCTAAGVCTEVRGLTNGSKADYTARAVNTVGESRAGVTTTAWAYAPPAPPTDVTWQPTVNTGGTGERIDLSVRVTDASTRELEVVSPVGETRVVAVDGPGIVTVPAYVVGSNTPVEVVITPITRHELPPAGEANARGAAVSVTANGVGAPDITDVTYTLSPARDQVTFSVSVATGGSGSTTWVGLQQGGTCTGMVQASSGIATVVDGATPNKRVDYTLCAESRRDGTVFGQAEPYVQRVYSYLEPGAPTVLKGYEVDDACVGSATSCETAVVEPNIQTPAGIYVEYSVGGGAWTTDFLLPLGAPPTVLARYCVDYGGGDVKCSTHTTTVTEEAGSATYPVSITVAPCLANPDPAPAPGEEPHIGSLTVLAVNAHRTVTSTMVDAGGVPVADILDMTGVRWDVTWSGPLAPLTAWTTTITCDVPPPDSVPDPDPPAGG